MSTPRMTKLDLLEYALTGAQTDLGTQIGSLTEEEEDLLFRDIAEIERRIKLVKYAAARREAQ